MEIAFSFLIMTLARMQEGNKELTPTHRSKVLGLFSASIF